MKLIIAVIKPSRLDQVLDAVTEAGASGLTRLKDGLQWIRFSFAAALDSRAASKSPVQKILLCHSDIRLSNTG